MGVGTDYDFIRHWHHPCCPGHRRDEMSTDIVKLHNKYILAGHSYQEAWQLALAEYADKVGEYDYRKLYQGEWVGEEAENIDADIP